VYHCNLLLIMVVLPPPSLSLIGSATSDESDLKEVVNGSDDMQSSHCTKQVVEHLKAGFKKDNILKVKKKTWNIHMMNNSINTMYHTHIV
jgi:hypothetical protein